MFGLKKQDKNFNIVSPFTSKAVNLNDVPDEVFSDKILGDGHAVLPKNNIIYSPVDGIVTNIADTKHAICFSVAGGAEILMHIGIDSVNLKGDGISISIKEDTRVKQGDIIGEIDFDVFSTHSIPTFTPVIITNSESFKITRKYEGDLKGGESVLFEYKKI